MVSENLKAKGFCVVQMLMEDGVSTAALEMANELKFGSLPDEFADEYLGVDSNSKVAWLPYEVAGADGNEKKGMATYDFEDLGPDVRTDDLDALSMCDKAMTNVGALLWPFTPEFEDEAGFFCYGRTNPLVRASIESGELKEVKSTVVEVVPASGDTETHLSFVDTKKLSMMFLIENEGGDLMLTPNGEAYDFTETTIKITRNTMIIFRCDSAGYSYTYSPAGRNLCLQTWVVDRPTATKEKEEQLRVIDGPEEPMGRRNNVMAMHTRYPGCGFEPLAFWNMLASGGDTQVKVPVARWDTDIYYRKEHTIGFSMTCHGAMIQQAEIEQFDNKFFGISDAEAMTMAPYMRVSLEVGYEALYQAGHRRENMVGWKCGVFVGDSGSDWDPQGYAGIAERPIMMFGRERSAAAARVSHIMGLTGPISTAETACSSSLVATGVCQMTMRFKEEDQRNPSLSTELYHGLVIGSNTLIGAGSYISLSGPGMLTSNGRCFTFDHSADGFARGEGIGSIKFKVTLDSVEAMGSYAKLIGACVNQDGRSASMTAPHGPSQQEVIRNSMREGGLSAGIITIAECHGTGTALGDPIEVGALRGVMKAGRSVPFMKTSAKTNIGHLEAGAGVAGLIKCIMMLNYCSGIPNIHLLTLNPHLDVAGYPVYFETEFIDFGKNSGLTGVSSFGFGGTNARADVWGHATKGARYSLSGALPKSRSLLI
jgi:polyketide synthase-associated protein